MLRHDWSQIIEAFVHHFLGLADRESANTIARKIKASDLGCTLQAQLFIEAALDNTKQALLRMMMRLLAAAGPTISALVCLLYLLKLCRVGLAFIKTHRNIRAKGHLDLHHFFRSELMSAAIDMGGKASPFVGQLA